MSANRDPIDSVLAAILPGKLRPEVRQAVDQILASPAVQATRSAFDEELQKRRRALVKRIQEAPQRWKAETDRRVKANVEAQQRLKEAQAELALAQQVASSAQVALFGISFVQQSDVARDEQELVATADPRLDRVIEQATEIFSALRHAGWSVTYKVGSALNGSPIMETASNAGEVSAAMAEVAHVIGEAKALKLRPMLRDEMTAALSDLVLTLEAALTGFDLNILRLNDLGDLVIDEHKGSRDLAERATAASRRGAPADAEAQD